MNVPHTPNWNDLLPNYEAIQKMDAEQLTRAKDAAFHSVGTLALGISGIGNLLACTASNNETGLSADAVTDVGWMLESLGGLLTSLSDTGFSMADRLHQIDKQPVSLTARNRTRA